MSKDSDNFEKQIKRIHDLIEQPDSEIIWNDRILDPDNPKQSRQIDVSIKREGALTLVECRFHNKPQDVKWVEELIGRKISLQADALIAVSVSGYTKGAINKARAHGIILRDVISLTEEEIRNWGKKTCVSVTFYKYEKITMIFVFDKKIETEISLHHIESLFKENPADIISLFNHISDGVEKANSDLVPCHLKIGLSSQKLRINKRPIKSIKFSGNFEQITKQFETPSVVAYDSPKSGALERNVYIEQVDQGQFEIMQSSDVFSVAIDLSKLKVPLNCHFRSVNCLFTKQMTLDSFYLVGPPKFSVALENLEIGIEFI